MRRGMLLLATPHLSYSILSEERRSGKIKAPKKLLIVSRYKIRDRVGQSP